MSDQEENKNINLYYEPSKAIVFFEHDGDSKEYAVQIFNIMKSKKGFELGAGKPVSDDDLTEIAMQFNQVKHLDLLHTSSLIPTNLLYYTGTVKKYKIIWFVPPGIRRLIFAKDLKIEDGEFHLPGLVFSADKDDLEVYAYKGIDAPNADTPLFHAPFLNVTGGSVCMGSAKFKPNTSDVETNIKEWEKGFFRSRFSHAGDDELVKDINVFDLHKKIRTQPFPEDKLISVKQKVRDLI